MAKSNPKSNQYELQKICEARGGTGLLIALLLTIAMNVVSNGVLRIFNILAPLLCIVFSIVEFTQRITWFLFVF